MYIVFDYPAIDTYTGGFSDTDSTTQIASETLALKEVSEFANGNIIMEGTLRANGNIIMEGTLQVNRIKGNSNEANKANISIVLMPRTIYISSIPLRIVPLVIYGMT